MTSTSYTAIFISVTSALLISYAMGFTPCKGIVGFSSRSRNYTSMSADGMPKLPKHVVKYSQVPKQGKVFTSTTIPKGLLKEHTTKKGTWGIINVSKGKLLYTINGKRSDYGDSSGSITFELSPQFHGVIQPQLLHQVKALTDDLEFIVEFLRLPNTGPVVEKREGL